MAGVSRVEQEKSLESVLHVNNNVRYSDNPLPLGAWLIGVLEDIIYVGTNTERDGWKAKGMKCVTECFEKGIECGYPNLVTATLSTLASVGSMSSSEASQLLGSLQNFLQIERGRQRERQLESEETRRYLDFFNSNYGNWANSKCDYGPLIKDNVYRMKYTFMNQKDKYWPLAVYGEIVLLTVTMSDYRIQDKDLMSMVSYYIFGWNSVMALAKNRNSCIDYINQVCAAFEFIEYIVEHNEFVEGWIEIGLWYMIEVLKIPPGSFFQSDSISGKIRFQVVLNTLYRLSREGVEKVKPYISSTVQIGVEAKYEQIEASVIKDASNEAEKVARTEGLTDFTNESRKIMKLVLRFLLGQINPEFKGSLLEVVRARKMALRQREFSYLLGGQ